MSTQTETSALTAARPLEGRVAVVTGASSGIGFAAARRLGRAGARVVMVSRSGDELEQAREAVERAGAEALGVEADITDSAALERLYREAFERWGRVDIVFANAGVNGVWAPIEELRLEEWRETLEINLTGTFLTIKHAVPFLRRGEGGSVIITSSVNGTRMFSNTGATAYACSKAGQVALAKMLAVELGPQRIRVNVICPGAVETQIDENTERRHLEHVRIPVEYPEGRIPLTEGEPASADQVAELVLFLASDAADHISGTELWIDGAQSLLQG
jgi:NAD(P)-dependent dehydrogenase (short-subunit alcohol dehydrogenase family)